MVVVSMSEYQCPLCGYASKPSDPRAQEQGVCADCWTEFYMQNWYQVEEEKTRDRQHQSQQPQS